MVQIPPHDMAVHTRIEKQQGENNMAVIRRFTKRVQSSGVLPKLRKNRFLSREISPTLRKQKALKKLERRERWQELYKLGKVSTEKKKRRQ